MGSRKVPGSQRRRGYRWGRTHLALAEADRLGTLAEAARFRLRLVSGQPEPLADAAFAHMDALRGATDQIAPATYDE
ncbi:hypothetical protein [Streptosporangium sp. NPDC087985]|uniref:hypothetical protein n=1 Tax=Streptosporangium sp. NPDC087985 TaxID=3366196 RepID=UPI0037FE3730